MKSVLEHCRKPGGADASAVVVVVVVILIVVPAELVSCFVYSSKMHAPRVQEGQHPLTGQRAANFRLLANQ